MAERPITMEEILTLARLVLRLGEVERVPTHPDGVRRETDTTHSAMLAVTAAVAADRMGLDPGKAALLALVHDWVEIYAGDTDTSRGLSAEEHSEKAKREEFAFLRLLAETESMPAIRRWLMDVEWCSSPEARLVKLLDKAMPKAVRLVGRRARGEGPPDDDTATPAVSQALRLRTRFPEPELEPIHQVSDRLRARLFEGAGGGSRG